MNKFKILNNITTKNNLFKNPKTLPLYKNTKVM